jgi:hypothetical protein
MHTPDVGVDVADGERLCAFRCCAADKVGTKRLDDGPPEHAALKTTNTVSAVRNKRLGNSKPSAGEPISPSWFRCCAALFPPTQAKLASI